MAAREEVGIELVAHDLASSAIRDVGGSLDGLQAPAKRATSSLAGIGNALKSAILPLVGAGIGAAFSAALAGANELDAATRRLQADAGLTAEEATKAQHALAGMYANNLQGFDAIGAAMASVHNDLGLVGEEADKVTASFLKFGTATGQDAAAAVASLNDILDSFDLEAKDSVGVMDMLVASHQKYGGVIAESERALALLAPALTAANMDIRDAIALLNLFNAAGIDASRAPQALAMALSKVKSPEELKRLIADISATVDPFERGEKAAKLFGQRAGVQLASALAGATLSDYAISMSEAAGATDRAAKAVESGFGAQFQLIMHQAGGALAEFGTQFGYLVIVASAVGPQMVRAIGAGLGGIAGFIGPKLIGGMLQALANATVVLTPAAAGLGTEIGVASGTAAGGAFAGAFAAAIPAAIAAIIVAAGTAIALAIDAMFPGLAKQMHDNFMRGLEAVGDFVGIGKRHADQYYNGWGGGTREAEPRLATQARSVGDIIARNVSVSLARMPRVGDIIADGMAKSQATVNAAAAALAASAVNVVKSKTPAMAGAGVAHAIALADGLTAARGSILAASKDLVNALLHPHTVGWIRSKLAGALHAKSLVDGINAGDPAVRGAAMAQAIAILTYLDALKGPAYVAGQNAAWALAKGLVDSLTKLTKGGIGKALLPELDLLRREIGSIYSVFPTYQQQVAKLAVSPGTLAGNKALGDLIAYLGGQAGVAEPKVKALGSAVGSAGSAGHAAAEGLKALADTAKGNLVNAFDKLKTSARTFFDDLHSKNLRAISDVRDLANAQLDAQIEAANAPVEAARAQLQAARDARELARLQAAASAPEATAEDQAALSDFMAEQDIKRLEQEAKTQVDALTAQKKANDDLAAEQAKAEDARYAAQVKAFDKEYAALLAYLKKHPAAWKDTNDKVLKLLSDYGVTYAAAGASLGAEFAKGLLTQEKAIRDAAKKLAQAAADVLKVASPAKIGPLAEDQSRWGEQLGRNWAAGLQRGLATYAKLPALADLRLTLSGAGPAPLAAPALRAAAVASPVTTPGIATINLNVTVAGGIVDPTGHIGQQIADSLVLPLRRAIDRNGIGLAAR